MATETSFDEHIPFPNMEISAVQPHRSVYNTSQFAIDGDLTGTWASSKFRTCFIPSVADLGLEISI